MIKVQLNNEMLKYILEIEQKRFQLADIKLPVNVANKLRKNSKKKSSYASLKIEGNPLTKEQADEVIERDAHKHFLKPEQEIRNYYLALNYLEEMSGKKEPFSKEMILAVQKLVEKGAPKEKIGLRGPMPPGVLFAVYDSDTGRPEYIPPEYSDVPDLLDELVNYVKTTDDHPLIIAAIVHYQIVTIHPFEDGNGRTARLLSGYILDFYGYGFNGIGSLEEYFAYDADEYYRSIQMGLPALYYMGRNEPPHFEIWICYFLRMALLYSQKASELQTAAGADGVEEGISYLKKKEKELLKLLFEENMHEYTPIDIAKRIGVSNRTVIDRLAVLVKNGFVKPVLVGQRIRTYQLSEFAISNKKEIVKHLKV